MHSVAANVLFYNSWERVSGLKITQLNISKCFFPASDCITCKDSRDARSFLILSFSQLPCGACFYKLQDYMATYLRLIESNNALRVMDRSFKKLSDKVWIKVAMHSVTPGGGVLLGWGCIQMLTLFQTKKCHFSHPFSDLACKKLCRHYLDWNTNKNNFLIYTFLFFSYSFGIERINTFIHCRSCLENQNWFQTKI